MGIDTASTKSSDNAGLSILQASLDANPSLEFVRFQWVDYTASVRTRLVTVRQALRLAAQGQGSSISVASPILSAFLVDGSLHEVTAGAKDSLIPDWSTLVVCHYQPGHAAVMCFVDEAGRGFDCCPRSLLKKVEREWQEQHDMSFSVGVEVEFYLAASAESTAPVKDTASYCSTASLRTPYLAVLEDSVRALELAQIPVWTFHSELVAGLFEISTEPMAPLRAADALVYIHETIKQTAVKHGLHATMHPKPFDKTHGVGQHMHISLSSDAKDDSFLAGVLDSVPAISAISMPNFDSYLRRDFAGGDWVSWDNENRTCSIRKIRRAYWEFRFIDGTANNYLTLVAILGVGMAAWEKGQELNMKPMSGRSPKLDEESRRELGIEKPAPRGLKDAIEALKEDKNVMTVLGNELWERFTNYKEKEEERLGELTLQERRTMIMGLF
jgi:glutamine synthetase